ncbi:MAG: hypothetical protein V7L26_13305 [Nostoc sp.]
MIAIISCVRAIAKEPVAPSSDWWQKFIYQMPHSFSKNVASDETTE